MTTWCQSTDWKSSAKSHTAPKLSCSRAGGRLTYDDVVPVHGLEVVGKVPHSPKALVQQATEHDQAGHPAEDRKGGHLEELHARAVQHLQGKQGACRHPQSSVRTQRQDCKGGHHKNWRKKGFRV